jgi:hypothetical protein
MPIKKEKYNTIIPQPLALRTLPAKKRQNTVGSVSRMCLERTPSKNEQARIRRIMTDKEYERTRLEV